MTMILQGRPSFGQNLVSKLATDVIPQVGKTIHEMISNKISLDRAKSLEQQTGIPGFASMVIASGGDVDKAAKAYQNLAKSRAMLADLGLEGGGGQGQGQDQGLYGAVGPQQAQQQRLPEPTPTDIYDRAIKAENVDREQNLAQEPLSGQQMTNRWQQYNKTPEFQQIRQNQQAQQKTSTALKPLEAEIELQPLTPIPGRAPTAQRQQTAEKLKRMSYYNPQAAGVQERLLKQSVREQELERTESNKQLSQFLGSGESIAQRKQDLATVRTAINSGNVGPVSWSNIGARYGYKELQGPAGSALNTALKNFLIESLNKVTSGAGRPNMFIEQQITNGFPMIGQPKNTNLASLAVAESRLAHEEQYARLVTKIKHEYENQYGSAPWDRVLSEADRQIASWDKRNLTSLEDRITSLNGQKILPMAKAENEEPSKDVMRHALKISNGDPEIGRQLLVSHGYKRPD